MIEREECSAESLIVGSEKSIFVRNCRGCGPGKSCFVRSGEISLWVRTFWRVGGCRIYRERERDSQEIFTLACLSSAR